MWHRFGLVVFLFSKRVCSCDGPGGLRHLVAGFIITSVWFLNDEAPCVLPMGLALWWKFCQYGGVCPCLLVLKDGLTAFGARRLRNLLKLPSWGKSKFQWFPNLLDDKNHLGCLLKSLGHLPGDSGSVGLGGAWEFIFQWGYSLLPLYHPPHTHDSYQ